MVQRTVTKVINLPDNLVKQAKKDLANLYDPRSMCYMDGYYSKSLVEKYGMSLSDLESLIGRPKFNTELKWEYDA